MVAGEIDANEDLSKFVTAVQANNTRVILFKSPGGNVLKAMELGRLIRSLRLATVQVRAGECESACALAFMGGVIRFADPGSIGVHKSSFADTSGMNVSDAVSAVQQLTADVMTYMTEMGIDPALMQLALKYDSDDIRYLSGSEMEQYRVALNGAKPLPSASAQVNPSGTPAVPSTSWPNAQTAPAVASLPPVLAPTLDLSIPAARSGKVQTYKGMAPLKATPTMASPTVENFANGSPATILGDTGKWYRVRVGSRVGYMFRDWVWVDQFDAAPFGRQFVQVKSFDNLAQTEQYVRSSGLPLVAYISRNGWFAIALDRTFEPNEAKTLLETMKANGSIPDDSIATYGNAYAKKVCCSAK
ncbi:hypothetical protein QD357_20830 [Rhizobium sp. BR 317]|uniref:hypothetical protein n=1 Tax=Rhizobium sp. BR 317 TaxID=3040015 RepID=UPI0039BF2A9B